MTGPHSPRNSVISKPKKTGKKENKRHEPYKLQGRKEKNKPGTRKRAVSILGFLGPPKPHCLPLSVCSGVSAVLGLSTVPGLMRNL